MAITITPPVSAEKTDTAHSVGENPPLLTFEEMIDMDFDEVVEIVEGTVQFMGNNNPQHAEVLTQIVTQFQNHLNSNRIGKVFSGDVGIIIQRNPDTGRAADLAFVSNKTLENQPPDAAALQVAPELIVEINSPSNYHERILQKTQEYFKIGVKELWIVSPAARSVIKQNSLRSSESFFASDPDPTISCPDILPDFQLNIADLFQGLPPLNDAEAQ